MLGLAMPLLLVQDCWRAGFFAAGRGDLAFANDAVWALVQFPLMVVVLTSTASRSVAVFVLVWSAGGAAAALFGALQARSVPRPDRVTGWFGRHRDLAPRFFGEFVAVNATLTGTTYLTAAFGGMTAAAALRAAQVALSPLHIIAMGLTSVAVPHAVRLRHTSPRKLWPFARRLGAVMAGSCMVWGALVVLVPTDTGRHLLGPSWPSARAVLVPLTVAMAAGGACTAAIVGLRGIAAASRSLRARVWGGVTTLSFAALGAYSASALGAATGLALGLTLGATLAWWELHRATHEVADSMNEARPHPRVEHVASALIRPEVVYIGGADRSGSIILGLVMGALPGTAHVGEVIHVWRRGVAENQLCGCGAPFLECPFWREVGQRAFGGWQHVDLDHVEWFSRRVVRERFGIAMPLLKQRQSYRANFAAYLEYIDPLYRAMWRVSGARRIVDSSKVLSQYGALAALTSWTSRSCILCVTVGVWRPRGRASSVRPEITSEREYMPTFNTTWMALQWDFMNVAFDIARILMYRDRPSVLMRYESFATDPVRVSRAALASVSETPPSDGMPKSSPFGGYPSAHSTRCRATPPDSAAPS